MELSTPGRAHPYVQSTWSDPVVSLLQPRRRGSLRAFLELPVNYSLEEAEDAVRAKAIWAQARVHHPKYKVLALSILAHREQLRHRALQCASAPLTESVERTLETFWRRLQNTAGLSGSQRQDLLRREARRVGVDPSRCSPLVLRGSPELGRAVGEALAMGGSVSAGVSDALADHVEPDRAMLRLTAPKRQADLPPLRRRREALLELADGIKGLLLQRALHPTSQESLVREAYRGGLAPHRARALCQEALQAWMAFRSGDRDAYAVIGPGSAHTQKVRYLKRRTWLQARVRSPEDLKVLVRLDAAWTSLGS